jgi:thioredoxin reductase
MRRNRFAATSHGVLAQDGRPGAEIAAEASAQLARYPDVRQVSAQVASIEGADGCFTVRTGDGAAYSCRKILLATGVVDSLPEVPGLAERWGRSVFHCPYCHGYEIGGGDIGVLYTAPTSVSQAVTLADWGKITLFAGGSSNVDVEQRSVLRRRGVSVVDGPVIALEGPLDGPVKVCFGDGSHRIARGIFLASEQAVSPLARALGLTLEQTPHGTLIATGDDKQTSVPGIYAAGDTARLPSNVTLASADGVLAGAAMHQALIADDLKQAV